MSTVLLVEFPLAGEVGKPVPGTFQVQGPVSAPEVLVRITCPDGRIEEKKATGRLTGDHWEGDTDFLPENPGRYTVAVVYGDLRQETTVEVAPAAAKSDEDKAEVPDKGWHPPLSSGILADSGNPEPEADFFAPGNPINSEKPEAEEEPSGEKRWFFNRYLLSVLLVCIAACIVVIVYLSSAFVSDLADDALPSVAIGNSKATVSSNLPPGVPVSATPTTVSSPAGGLPAVTGMATIPDGKGGFHQVMETFDGTKATAPVDVIGKQGELDERIKSLEKSVGKLGPAGDKLASDLAGLKKSYDNFKADIAKAAQATTATPAASASPSSSATPTAQGAPSVVASALIAPAVKAVKIAKAKSGGGGSASAPLALAPAAFKPEKYGQYVATVTGGVETLAPAKSPFFQGVSERRTAPDGTEYFVQSDISITPIAKLGK